MPDVAVLLSTWNGMRFLPDQIDSLLAQAFDGELSILVRDDGSSDGTVDYLRSRDPRITVIEGENLGPRDSFLALIRHAKGVPADMFALCDQDDVWRPHKIARALARMAPGRPAFYASSLDLVDDALRPIRTYVHPGDRSFATTLMCNFATGCTCMFNRPFLDRLTFPPDREPGLMHDWWLAAAATVIADIDYDRTSSIAYRQHASNHVGIASGLGAMTRKIVTAVASRPAVTRFDQARQIHEAWQSEMTAVQHRMLDDFLRGERSALRRLLFAVRHGRAAGWRTALRFTLLG